MNTRTKPLVYACSGCSSTAQTANDVAVVLQQQGLATMGCITGVGGQVAPLVQQAKTADTILAIDGCCFQCVRHTLQQAGVEPTWHVDVSEFTNMASPTNHATAPVTQLYQLLQHIQGQLLLSDEPSSRVRH